MRLGVFPSRFFFCDIFLIIDALQAVEKVPEFRFLAKEDVRQNTFRIEQNKIL